jgi:Tim10/DDP family zinc finger
LENPIDERKKKKNDLLSTMSNRDKIEDIRLRYRSNAMISHQWRIKETVAKHCFAACVPLYGDHLSLADKKCLSGCTALFRQAHQIVASAFAARYRLGDGDDSMMLGFDDDDDDDAFD